MKRNAFIVFAILILAGCATYHDNTSRKDKFQEFVQDFTVASLPFEIKGNEPLKPLTDEYFHAIYGKKMFVPELTEHDFGRDVASNASYVASFHQDSKYAALCYVISNSLADTLATTNYMIVTYNMQTGRRIDRLECAGMSSPEKFSSMTFSDKNVITVSSYKNIWEKNPKEIAYDQNKIVRTELLSTMHYQLNETGHFVKIPGSELSAGR